MYRVGAPFLKATFCTGLAFALMVNSAGTVTAASATTVTTAAARTVTFASATAAQLVFDRITQAQRIGQLFMVGGPVTGLKPATISAIRRYHVGNLILTGRTTTGTPWMRSLTAASNALTSTSATARVPLFIAADQ